MWKTKAQISLCIRVVWSAPFFVRCLDSIIPLVSISEISSLYLASLAAQAGLCLTRSQTSKTGFFLWWGSVGLQYLRLITRKPVFGVWDQSRLKVACAATEARQRLEISDIETGVIILSRQWTTKVLIRLCGCAGWSSFFLFAYGITGFLMTWLIWTIGPCSFRKKGDPTGTCSVVPIAL